MDRGQLFEHEFEVLPMKEGGFVVVLGRNFGAGELTGERRWAYQQDRWAFSNVTDLMRWLNSHATAPDPHQPGNEEKIDHMAVVRSSVKS